jgi:hypothetical protein
MKKIILTIVLFVGYNSICQSQTESVKPKSFISILGGYSKMGGEIIRTEYSENSSGFSSANGYLIGFDGGYSLTKNVGLYGSFSMNRFNSSGLDILASGYLDDFEVESITLNVKGNYSFYNLMVGPYFQFPFNKFVADFKLTAGMVYAKTPEYQVDIEDQTDATFYQRSATSLGLGSQIGIGLRYSFTDKIGLKLNADYLYTKPSFQFENVNRLNNAGRLVSSYSPTITQLNLSLGVIYQFGK